MFHRHRWRLVTNLGHGNTGMVYYQDWECVKCGKHQIKHVLSPPAWQVKS